MTLQVVDTVTHPRDGSEKRRARLPAFAPPPGSEEQLLSSERIAFVTPFRGTQWICTTHWFAIPSNPRASTWCRARRIVPVHSDVGISAVEAAATPGITLLVSHTDVCLPSETCEPILEALIRRLEAQAATRHPATQEVSIEEIWIVDAFAAGALSHFVDWYLPIPSSTTALQSYGPQWPRPCLPTQSSAQAGAQGRRIVCLTVGMSATHVASLDAAEGLLVVRSDWASESDMYAWVSRVRALYTRFRAHVTLGAVDSSELQLESGPAWRHTLYGTGLQEEETHCDERQRGKGGHCVSEPMAGASRFVAQQDPERVGRRLADILIQRREDTSLAPTLLFQARL